jgi:hypothetical protein
MSLGGIETFTQSGATAETATFTLYVGTGLTPNTSTGITCSTASIPSGLGSIGGCSDSTHTFTVTPGETLSIREHLSNENFNTDTTFNWTVHLTCF